MSTTSTTSVQVLQSLLEGIAYYLSDAAVYLVVFAFIFGMFTSLITIMVLWKVR